MPGKICIILARHHLFLTFLFGERACCLYILSAFNFGKSVGSADGRDLLQHKKDGVDPSFFIWCR